MRSWLTLLAAAIAALVAVFFLFVSVVGFSAAQHACPGNDCSDATGVGWIGVSVALAAGVVTVVCVYVAKRQANSRRAR